MATVNTAKFTINATASEDGDGNRQFEGTNSQTLTLTLEVDPAPVLSVTYSVYDSTISTSPLASKDAPLLTFDGSSASSETPGGVNDDVTIDLPATGAHSYLIECQTSTPEGSHTFIRGVFVPETTTTPDTRKTVPGETSEFLARGFSDVLNDMVGAAQGSGSRRRAVIDFVVNTSAPPTEVLGDRYMLDNTGASHADWDGASGNDLVEFNGTTWDAETPEEGWVAFVDTDPVASGGGAGSKDYQFVDDGTPVWQVASSSAPVDSVFSRTGVVVAATNDYTWAQVNKATSDIADITTKSHTDLTDIGSNAHSVIDTHLGSSSNPHTTTLDLAYDGGASVTVDAAEIDLTVPAASGNSALNIVNSDVTSFLPAVKIKQNESNIGSGPFTIAWAQEFVTPTGTPFSFFGGADHNVNFMITNSTSTDLSAAGMQAFSSGTGNITLLHHSEASNISAVAKVQISANHTGDGDAETNIYSLSTEATKANDDSITRVDSSKEIGIGTRSTGLWNRANVNIATAGSSRVVLIGSTASGVVASLDLKSDGDMKIDTNTGEIGIGTNASFNSDISIGTAGAGGGRAIAIGTSGAGVVTSVDIDADGDVTLSSTTGNATNVNGGTDLNLGSGAGSIFLTPSIVTRQSVSAPGLIGGSTPPSLLYIDQFAGFEFDADAESAHGSFRIPESYDGTTDLALEMEWMADPGTALADTETVKWDVSYRSVADGEAADAGTVATATATTTQTGAGTDKERYTTSITVPATTGNQPVVAADLLGFEFDRDVTGDTYGAGAVLIRINLVHTCNRIPTH